MTNSRAFRRRTDMQTNMEKHWDLLRDQGVHQISPAELKQIRCGELCMSLASISSIVNSQLILRWRHNDGVGLIDPVLLVIRCRFMAKERRHRQLQERVMRSPQFQVSCNHHGRYVLTCQSLGAGS